MQRTAAREERIPAENPAKTSYFMGWIDQNQEVQAYQRSNGEYVVTEEEQIGAKVTVLRGLLQNFTQY